MLAQAILLMTAADPVQDAPLPILPQPVRAERLEGEFTLRDGAKIGFIGRHVEPVAQRLQEMLQPATGFDLSTQQGTGDITLRIDESLGRLGPEGYLLLVEPDGVTISAAQPAGLFYGCQTFRQLLPPAIYRQEAQGVNWTAPACEVEDYPRFQWRGLMLDVARHFQPIEVLYRFVDLLAMHRMNRLHLHLTEDQGWRIEIKAYPRLTEIGAWRDQTLIGHGGKPREEWRFDGQRHGGYYTQEQLRDLVAYAAERFVTVMPEIEMPGHAQAAIASYPWLGNNPDQQLEVLEYWGVSSNVYSPAETTFRFIFDVLKEVLAIFPSEFIHIGGDECPKVEWEQSELAQRLIADHKLADEHGLQSWFVGRVDEWLTEHGRRLVGWDEILEGGLAPGATVMSWRGISGGIAAAKAGHDVVMAPTSHLYFDYYQGPPEQEPLGIGGNVPIERVYSFDPVPEELDFAESRHVLGAQAQLWSEYIATAEHLEYMAFPRACALAEVVWSPQESREWGGFERRLNAHLARLNALGVNYRRPDWWD